MNQGSQYQAPPSPWNQQPSQGNQYPGNQGGNQYGQQQYQQPPTPAPLMQVYEKKPEAKYVIGGSGGGGGMVSPPLAQIQVSC